MGVTMKKHLYSPDKTLKNAMRIMFQRYGTVVLSCKDCPQGVSPTGKGYVFAACTLIWNLSLISYAFSIKIINYIAPVTWSTSTKRLYTLFSVLGFCAVLVPVSTFLSMGFTKWVPAQSDPNKNTGDDSNHR